ncbi:hypothetical protein ACWCO0_27955 [Streptomyces tubercidicus]
MTHTERLKVPQRLLNALFLLHRDDTAPHWNVQAERLPISSAAGFSYWGQPSISTSIKSTPQPPAFKRLPLSPSTPNFQRSKHGAMKPTPGES